MSLRTSIAISYSVHLLPFRSIHHVGIITLWAISRFFLSDLIVLAVLRDFPKYSSPCQENTLAQRKRMALNTYIHLNSECLASMTPFCWSSWNCAMQNWTCPLYGNGISFTVPNHQSSFYNSWQQILYKMAFIFYLEYEQYVPMLFIYRRDFVIKSI